MPTAERGRWEEQDWGRSRSGSWELHRLTHFAAEACIGVETVFVHNLTRNMSVMELHRTGYKPPMRT